MDIGQSANVSGGETRYVKVTFDAVGTNGYQAMNADSLTSGRVPAFGSYLGPFRLTGKYPTRVTPVKWIVRLEYTLPTPGNEPAPEVLDVVDGSRWAITINSNSVAIEEEIQRDINGDPIANTAGDAISGVTTTRYDEELTISFTTNIVDYIGIDACIGGINLTEFTMTIRGQVRTFAALTVRFTDYAIETVLDPSGVNYPRVTYKLRIRKDTWLRKIANKGCYGLSYPGPLRVPLLDDSTPNRNFVTTPQYLLTDVGTGDVTRAAIGDAVEILPVTGDDTNGEGLHIYSEVDLAATLVWDLEN